MEIYALWRCVDCIPVHCSETTLRNGMCNFPDEEEEEEEIHCVHTASNGPDAWSECANLFPANFSRRFL